MIHKMVPRHGVLEHLRLGWMASDWANVNGAMVLNSHLVWLCGCAPVEPRAPAQWDRVGALFERERGVNV